MNPNIKQELDRYNLLVSCIPDLFTRSGTCLYIGASIARFQMGDRLMDAGYDLTIVEPWPPNAHYYRDKGFPVVQDDIRNAVCYLKKHDVVMWWHGPEHVSAHDLAWLISTLECLANRHIIFAYPYGEYKQGAHGGNPYEAHLSILYPSSFPGYRSAWIGKDGGGPDSCVIAWKAL